MTNRHHRCGPLKLLLSNHVQVPLSFLTSYLTFLCHDPIGQEVENFNLIGCNQVKNNEQETDSNFDIIFFFFF